MGELLATVAILRLRRLRQPQLGNAPDVIYVAGGSGVFALEELLSLLLALGETSSSDAPT